MRRSDSFNFYGPDTMTQSLRFLRYSITDGIAEILMDNGPVNALSVPMLDELLACFEQAAADDSVRAIILGSAVPGRFCAGLDLKAFANDDTDGVRALLERLYTRFTDLQYRLGKPSIAAVNGTARGGGMTLSISCDMIVADSGADLGYPEIDVGLQLGYRAARPRPLSSSRRCRCTCRCRDG